MFVRLVSHDVTMPTTKDDCTVTAVAELFGDEDNLSYELNVISVISNEGHDVKSTMRLADHEAAYKAALARLDHLLSKGEYHKDECA